MKFPWFGILLILVGAGLLLDRTGVISFGWHLFFWSVLAVYGGFKLINGFPAKRRGQVFWGAFFLGVGAYNVLSELDLYELPPFLAVPAFLVLIGLGFLLVFACTPRDWHLLVPGVFFLGLGTLTGLSDLGYMYRWDVMHFVSRYWPVALILFGVSLLLNRRAA